MRIERLRHLSRICKPVELACNIGAVVAAITGTHTTVIYLHVDLLGFAVVAGKNRADRLTRGVSALLAEDGLEIGINIRILSVPEAFDMDPLHATPNPDIFLPYGR